MLIRPGKWVTMIFFYKKKTIKTRVSSKIIPKPKKSNYLAMSTFFIFIYLRMKENTNGFGHKPSLIS